MLLPTVLESMAMENMMKSRTCIQDLPMLDKYHRTNQEAETGLTTLKALDRSIKSRAVE